MEPLVSHGAEESIFWVSDNHEIAQDPLAADVKPKVEPSVKLESGSTPTSDEPGRDMASRSEEWIDTASKPVKDEPVSPCKPSLCFLSTLVSDSNCDAESSESACVSPTHDPLELKPCIVSQDSHESNPVVVKTELNSAEMSQNKYVLQSNFNSYSSTTNINNHDDLDQRSAGVVRYELKKCYVSLSRCRLSDHKVPARTSSDSADGNSSPSNSHELGVSQEPPIQTKIQSSSKKQKLKVLSPFVDSKIFLDPDYVKAKKRKIKILFPSVDSQKTLEPDHVKSKKHTSSKNLKQKVSSPLVHSQKTLEPDHVKTKKHTSSKNLKQKVSSPSQKTLEPHHVKSKKHTSSKNLKQQVSSPLVHSQKTLEPDHVKTKKQSKPKLKVSSSFDGSQKSGAPDHVQTEKLSDPREFKCDNCDKSYKCKGHLVKHKLSACLPPYVCLKCNKSFSQKIFLSHHKKTHREEYKCDVCSKVFSTKSYLIDHESVHSSTPASCPTCERVFSREKALRTHLKTHHKIVTRNFSCGTCGKTFFTRAICRNHEKIHVKPFKCVQCVKAFSTKQLLAAHLIMHSGRKDHICDICGNSFAIARCLKAHLRIHMDNTFTCADCNQMFKAKHILQAHIVSKHIPREQRKSFPCPVCKMSLISSCNLAKHLKTHDTRKCPSCEFVCATYFEMKAHTILAHGGERKHKCRVCGFSYVTIAERDRHEKKHVSQLNCPFCPKSYSIPASYYTHLHKHKVDDRLAADKVEKARQELSVGEENATVEKQRRRNYNDASTLVTSKAGTFSCHICSKIFPTIKILSRHQSIHTKRFKCEKCDEIFQANCYLQRHQEVHATIKNHHCNLCNESFSLYDNLNRHVKRKHGKKVEKSYFCNFCKKRFTARNRIEYHISSKHLSK